MLLSNSTSLGFGNRRTLSTGLNYQGSNYQILENRKSAIAELNTVIGNTMSNSLIFGYNNSDESRSTRLGTFFPFVDILNASTVYTSFGYEPFTPNNELRYNEFQLQNNFNKFAEKHSMTAGFSFERYNSENVFYPGAQSVYVYNSLQDFYDDVNRVRPVDAEPLPGPLQQHSRPGEADPAAARSPTSGAYAQDEWTVTDKFKVIAGVRMDVPIFGDTGYANANADALTFRDETGAPVQYDTAKLPDAEHPVVAARRLQHRRQREPQHAGARRHGHLHRQAAVRVDLEPDRQHRRADRLRASSTTPPTRPFNPNPDAYKPTNVTGAPAASYELALTDENFKFPQVWRSNIAVDQRLPWGITGTAEFLYNRDVNGVYYINANLPAAQTTFAGADSRMRWTDATASTPTRQQRLQRHRDEEPERRPLVERRVLGAQEHDLRHDRDRLQLRREQEHGGPGFDRLRFVERQRSTRTIRTTPGLAFAGASPGSRFFLTGSYRKEYFGFGATSFSAFWESRTIGNQSFVFAGDLNGDGGTANDLLYIHRNVGEMNFSAIPAAGAVRAFTPRSRPRRGTR